MKCLNCESELFENEFKDLQCTNCGSIYPFSNKGLSNGGCAKTEDIDIIDLINCLEARIGVYETCNARKDESIKHLEREVKKLQAENKRLKDNGKLESENITLNALIEMKNDTINNLMKTVGVLENQVKTAKTEAYKECLGKIEQRDVSESDFYIMVKKTEFDNLLKEFERKESTTYDD